MDIREMVALIQYYIYIRKGVEVDINPHSAHLRLDLTAHMYGIATEWFNKTNGRVEYIS